MVVYKEGCGRDGAKVIGTHFIGDFSGCKKNLTETEPAVELALSVVLDAGLTPVRVVAEKIDPGITVVVILKESKLCVDTWPELGYAAADLFTCGDETRGEAAFQRLYSWFEPESFRVWKYVRRCVCQKPAKGDGR